MITSYFPLAHLDMQYSQNPKEKSQLVSYKNMPSLLLSLKEKAVNNILLLTVTLTKNMPSLNFCLVIKIVDSSFHLSRRFSKTQ